MAIHKEKAYFNVVQKVLYLLYPWIWNVIFLEGQNNINSQNNTVNGIHNVLERLLCHDTKHVIRQIFAHATTLCEKLHAVHTMVHSNVYTTKNIMCLSGQSK